MAAYLVTRAPSGSPGLTWLLAAILIAVGLLPELLRAIAPGFSLWAKPLAAAIFLAAQVYDVLDHAFDRRRVQSAAGPGGQVSGSEPAAS
jgi:hypothetical protein